VASGWAKRIVRIVRRLGAKPDFIRLLRKLGISGGMLDTPRRLS
jgi:hypothetical protein